MLTHDELEAFYEKHCRFCGTQRCHGVFDEEFREGCEHYQKATGTYDDSRDNVIYILNEDAIKLFSGR